MLLCVDYIDSMLALNNSKKLSMMFIAIVLKWPYNVHKNIFCMKDTFLIIQCQVLNYIRIFHTIPNSMSNVDFFSEVHLSKQWFHSVGLDIIVDLDDDYDDDDGDDDGDDNDDDDANNEEVTLLNAMTTVVHLDQLLIDLSMQNDNDADHKNSDNDDHRDDDDFDGDYEYDDHSASLHLRFHLDQL